MYQKEAAKRLGVAVSTLRAWERAGLIANFPYYKGKHRRNYSEAEVEQIRWNLLAKRPGKANFPKRFQPKPDESSESSLTQPNQARQERYQAMRTALQQSETLRSLTRRYPSILNVTKP